MAPNGPWRWTPDEIEKLAEELRIWAADEQNLFLKEFTASRGIPASYIARFAQASPAFAEVLEVVNDLLETRLLRGGLRRALEHNVVKLVAVSKYGYTTDRNDVALAATAKATLPTSVDEADKQIAELQAHREVLAGLVTQAQELGTGIVEG